MAYRKPTLIHHRQAFLRQPCPVHVVFIDKFLLMRDHCVIIITLCHSGNQVSNVLLE